MCFYIGPSTTKQIAKEDIIVYKECALKNVNGDLYLRGKYQTAYLYSKSNRAPIKKVGKDSIENGLHSNIERCYNHNTTWIIPKGATYYKNKFDYVSNRLVFKDFITDPYVNEGRFKSGPITICVYNGEVGEEMNIEDVLKPISSIKFANSFISTLYSFMMHIL